MNDQAAISANVLAAQLRALDPAYAATPLLDLTALAARLGIAQLLAKDEGRRAHSAASSRLAAPMPD